MKNSRKIVVLGGGESGYGSAVLAKVKGFEVFVSDFGAIPQKYKEKLLEWEIPFEERGHSMERILDAGEVVKSPGIPDSAPVVKAVLERGIGVVSEIEFAGRYIGGARTICITGSNGKTTTTTLTHRLLKDAGLNVALGGNIGESFAYSVATGEYDWYVLELSSFQLDGTDKFRADVGVLMNITPDHLDRYGYCMQNYVNSKMRIIRNQREQDYFVFCGDDKTILAELGKYPMMMRGLPFTAGGGKVKVGELANQAGGAYLSGDAVMIEVDRRRFECDSKLLKIKGIHNIYNTMAAVMAAMAAGVGEESIRRTLAQFEGVEHRLERVGEFAGVEYVNDSKATNTDSVWYAFQSMTKPVVWIAGGTDKGNDYLPLMEMAREKVKAVVCMGVDNAKLIGSFEGVVPVVVDTHSMNEAMESAVALAREGDVVLLSPACASFDLFENYEDRGRRFKEWIHANLTKK